MGATASIVNTTTEINNSIDVSNNITTIALKKLPEAIEEAIYVHEKFPLIIDKTEQAGRFLKYQTGTYINYDDPIQNQIEFIHKSLLGSIQYGRTLTLSFKTLETINENIFQPKLFPKEIINKTEFFKEENWKSVLPKTENEEDEILISSEFVFIMLTNTDYIPAELYNHMYIIKVVDKNTTTATTGAGATTGNGVVEEDPMDQIASMLGAKEVIR